MYRKTFKTLRPLSQKVRKCGADGENRVQKGSSVFWNVFTVREDMEVTLNLSSGSRVNVAMVESPRDRI